MAVRKRLLKDYKGAKAGDYISVVDPTYMYEHGYFASEDNPEALKLEKKLDDEDCGCDSD